MWGGNSFSSKDSSRAEEVGQSRSDRACVVGPGRLDAAARAGGCSRML